ncbi:O-antigen translocase [Acinetobacter bereziniae]|uniref:O-antigen translocase n=1 Tax=Acinetobacter bereziniae TaxID=106648 RepID=UPI002074FA76|nr:O-antigen translocase [Acinetobacter bereziniae]MCM8512864.1 O-antigen translocase [Acinetobacter bereziniae]
MNLLKTSILNGIAVLIKTATMFILNKILAVYVGPSGYAAIGQFQNFIQMVTTFAGTAINNGIIKYTAEYSDNENKQQEVWKTAGSIIIIGSLLFSVFILIFKKQLALYLFHSTEYQSIFIWFAFFLVFFTFNTFLLGMLNGKKEIVSLVVANISGSIFSLMITCFLAIQYGLFGALIALCIYQSLAFFVTLTICYKLEWFKFKFLFGKINKKVSYQLAAFALMAFVSVFFGNISQIILRKLIISEFGLSYAGYWEAMTRLSTGYLMLVSTILGVYYLPKLSELQTYSEIKKEVSNGYKYILPLAIIMSVLVYLLKDYVVKIMFTEKFMPMLELMFWQLIGDVIKIGSWIVSFMMLSKAMTKLFIITEAFFLISIIPLTMIFMSIFGYKGISIAFAINGLVYWVVCSVFSFKSLKGIKL